MNYHNFHIVVILSKNFSQKLCKIKQFIIKLASNQNYQSVNKAANFREDKLSRKKLKSKNLKTKTSYTCTYKNTLLKQNLLVKYKIKPFKPNKEKKTKTINDILKWELINLKPP